MSRTLAWRLGVLVALGLTAGLVLSGCFSASGSRGVGGERTPAEQPRGSGAGVSEEVVFEIVSVTLEIPAAEDVPRGGAHGGSCPQDQLGNILGVTFSRPHGLVVGSVVPDGPADKAGIKPGDRLGARTDCPSSTLPLYKAGAEPREVKLTVRRPAAGEEAPSRQGPRG